MGINRRKRKCTNNLEQSHIVIWYFSSKDFKALFKGSSYYAHCAYKQNEARKCTDTDQKSCSYQIIELDIYFRTQQVGFFR